MAAVWAQHEEFALTKKDQDSIRSSSVWVLALRGTSKERWQNQMALRMVSLSYSGWSKQRVSENMKN